MEEKYLIHSNEFHLIHPGDIHRALENLIEALGMAAGSTEGFDLYKVVETYFTDIDKRREINRLLDIAEDNDFYAEEVQREAGETC